MKPYIYKITNKETGEYYIGSQCSGKRICINYWTSSCNKTFKEDFKKNYMTKYEVKIVKFVDNPKKCVLIENYIIRNYMKLKDGLCINRHYQCNDDIVFNNIGRKASEKIIQKLRDSHKGQIPYNKGKHMSDEARRKMSIAKKGKYMGEESPRYGKHFNHTEEAKLKIGLASKLRKRSDETREKLRISMTGKKASDEARRKMSIAKKGKENPSKCVKIICVETGVEYPSIKNAAEANNIKSYIISNCLRKLSKKAGGYTWIYKK